MDKLNEFAALFSNKNLVNGTEVALFWNVAGSLEVLVTPPQDAFRDYEKLTPEIKIQ